MNWDIFWLVLIVLVMGSLGSIAGAIFHHWVVARFGLMASLLLGIAGLIAVAASAAWFFG